MRRNVWVLLFAAGIMVGLGGCARSGEKLSEYMEERYDASFEYEGEANSSFGSSSFTARLSCPDYPGLTVLASYGERNGEGYYGDNFLAVKYHGQAEERIREAAGKVLEEYQVLLAEPDLVMSVEDPEAYTLEDYLADPLAFKTVWIVSWDEVDRDVFHALVQALAEDGISTSGILAVPRPGEEVPMTRQGVEELLAGGGRVKTYVVFKVEDGEVAREEWVCKD